MASSTIYGLKIITVGELLFKFNGYFYFLCLIWINYLSNIYLNLYLTNLPDTNNDKNLINFIINKTNTNVILFQFLFSLTLFFMLIHTRTLKYIYNNLLCNILFILYLCCFLINNLFFYSMSNNYKVDDNVFINIILILFLIVELSVMIPMFPCVLGFTLYLISIIFGWFYINIYNKYIRQIKIEYYEILHSENV